MKTQYLKVLDIGHTGKFSDEALLILETEVSKCVYENKVRAIKIITGHGSGSLRKIVRNWAMERLSEDLGIDLGSGYPADPKSKAAIEELCKLEELNDCLRRKWKNVDRAWMMHHRKPIPSRSITPHSGVQYALDEWN